MIFLPPPFMASGVSKSVVYTNKYVLTTNTTTYTFTACDLGTASTDRRVIVCAHMYGGTSRSLSSATINGVSATVLTTNTALTANAILIIANVPTDATGDIVLTWSGSCAGSAVTVWSAAGLTTDTPVAAVSSIASSPTSGSMATSSGGFVVGGVTVRYGDGTTRTHSWSGATEQHDTELENTGSEGASFTGAHATTTGANVTLTDTPSSAGASRRGAFASF